MLNDGNGDVISKNIDIIDSTRILSSYLTACKHLNQKDWWILQPDVEDQFITTLLSDGFGETIKQPTNFLPFNETLSSAAGTAKFSPYGNKYAFFNAYDNLLLYDFDRETGKLSNLITLAVVDVLPTDIIFASVEWSSNSRFLYIAAGEELWQVDNWEDNLEDGVILIDTYDGGLDPFPTTFYLMALAPDCKIYMAAPNGSQSYHVINNPNEKGTACNFVQQGIRFPFPYSAGTLPNFPHFRVDDAEKCDPGITSVFNHEVFYQKELMAYPNPLMDKIRIHIPDAYSGKLFLINLKGQVIWQADISLDTSTRTFDFSFLESGSYFLEFIPRNNPDKVIWSKKIFKH